MDSHCFGTRVRARYADNAGTLRGRGRIGRRQAFFHRGRSPCGIQALVACATLNWLSDGAIGKINRALIGIDTPCLPLTERQVTLFATAP